MKRRLKETLSESRWRHTEGVVRAAERMAEKFGVNVEKAHVAALLHDCAKCTRRRARRWRARCTA